MGIGGGGVVGAGGGIVIVEALAELDDEEDDLLLGPKDGMTSTVTMSPLFGTGITAPPL